MSLEKPSVCRRERESSPTRHALCASDSSGDPSSASQTVEAVRCRIGWCSANVSSWGPKGGRLLRVAEQESLTKVMAKLERLRSEAAQCANPDHRWRHSNNCCSQSGCANREELTAGSSGRAARRIHDGRIVSRHGDGPSDAGRFELAEMCSHLLWPTWSRTSSKVTRRCRYRSSSPVVIV